jgi:hypothetical protein
MRRTVKVNTAIKNKNAEICYCCGRTEEITIHHLRDIYVKTRAGKGKFNGYILLCRDCHDFVEVINNKHKRYLEENTK